MNVGRNDPCTCGSKMKYKKCCGRAGTAAKGTWSKVGMIAVGAALLVGLVGFAVSVVTSDGSGMNGMVWSPEHGHWHRADGSEPGGATPRPQPPGPAPAGKVWSVEHGHWHDLE